MTLFLMRKPQEELGLRSTAGGGTVPADDIEAISFEPCVLSPTTL